MCTCMRCNFDIQTTKQMSVQFDFHFFFGFVLLSVRRSMACCLQSRAKKEIQSCIVFWRAQCASKACSDYKAQGRRIRNYRRWETTETWWLLSGECMDFSTYISVLCKKFCMKYLVRQQRFQTLSAQWEMGRNLCLQLLHFLSCRVELHWHELICKPSFFLIRFNGGELLEFQLVTFCIFIRV